MGTTLMSLLVAVYDGRREVLTKRPAMRVDKFNPNSGEVTLFFRSDRK
ncbi:hypothetical protein A33K_18709 [Burkholderia humptydooensis MSMB43]|uniref:Uncharacterized protein n=1 Tax=Burkholderia humptydooensis MSMB43 TaxID=441157 RepID=A0ABN0FX14_9BURK|nr:hypothetical protein A33K_18709 [Burkholderia humptydooensis MSMB43]